MPDYSKNIIYLSKAQYQELVTNGSITVNNETITFSENDIYVTPQAEPVTDVRVNGTSVSSGGVANVPVASNQKFGVVKVLDAQSYGVRINSFGVLDLFPVPSTVIKAGRVNYLAINPEKQHESVFYGLAKIAGHDEKDSTESVGTYTPEAKGAIQQMLGVSDLIAPAENTLVASKAYAIGDVFTANGKLYKVTAVIAANDSIILQNSGETVSEANAEEIKLSDYAVHDVQVNGTSILDNNIANIPYATTTQYGLIKGGNGITLTNGVLTLYYAPSAQIKLGTNTTDAITPVVQHESTFYGLAKASGDTTQSSSSNAVGVYTDNAKASIKSMLGIVDGSTGTVDVSDTTPTITAVENTRYVCGEVTSLDFTPAASGICIVRFTSGSSVTVLTLPSTVKFPEWFDPTSLETNTIYEICITDGVYGAVMSWAQ